MARKITGPKVNVESVWADNSVNGAGRSIQVETIEHGYATCRVLTNSNHVQRDLDAGFYTARNLVGSVTRIRLDRFRPTNSGYTHITDTPEVTDDALVALLDSEPGIRPGQGARAATSRHDRKTRP